jgi:hypothetical protein
MPSLISSLSKPEQRQLLDDLNYLNMTEIKWFCRQRSIPYKICIETSDSNRVKTREDDRKGVILDRIRNYLNTGRIPEPTCFPASVVCLDKPARNPKATDPLCYGQYHKKNDAMMVLLRKLTGGKFKDGAIARILTREFWTNGIAPTYQEYAAAWLQASRNHQQPNPEWAFLSDRAAGSATTNWKRLRKEKARKVLGILKRQGVS